MRHLWNGGVFLYVPKNVEVELPLQALLYSDDAKATFAPHVLLIADNHSRVTYVDNVTTALWIAEQQPLAKQIDRRSVR